MCFWMTLRRTNNARCSTWLNAINPFFTFYSGKLCVGHGYVWLHICSLLLSRIHRNVILSIAHKGKRKSRKLSSSNSRPSGSCCNCFSRNLEQAEKSETKISIKKKETLKSITSKAFRRGFLLFILYFGNVLKHFNS